MLWLTNYDLKPRLTRAGKRMAHGLLCGNPWLQQARSAENDFHAPERDATKTAVLGDPTPAQIGATPAGSTRRLP
jgi:hypothetical protein